MFPLRTVVGLVERGVNRVARLVQREGDLVGTIDFPRVLQFGDGWSCGSRSVHAVCKHFGLDVSHDEIMEALGTDSDGTAASPIVRFFREQGLRAGYHRRMRFPQLENALGRGAVVIVDLEGTHWSVLTALSSDYAWLADPSLRRIGRRTSRARFRERWARLGIIVSERRSRRGRHHRRSRVPTDRNPTSKGE